MRKPTKRSKYIIATGVVASSLLFVACSDAPTGIKPPVAHVRMPAPTKTAFALVSHQVAGDTAVSLITLDTEQEDSFLLPDGAKVTFPAGSVCDIETSSYGAEEWDQPCDAQRTTVNITVRAWVDSTGHPRLDFSPRMRFNPAAGPVVISMVTADPAGTSLGINYCPDGADACIDESLADADLLTWHQPATGTYFRRVKHFSGYNIAAGRSLSISLSIE
jgi:hypothetical protein